MNDIFEKCNGDGGYFGKFRAIARDYETNQVGSLVALRCTRYACPDCHTSSQHKAGADRGRLHARWLQLSGMVYYMAGITLSVAAFPKSIEPAKLISLTETTEITEFYRARLFN